MKISSYHRRRSYFFRLYFLQQEIRARRFKFSKVIVNVQKKLSDRMIKQLLNLGYALLARALAALKCG